MLAFQRGRQRRAAAHRLADVGDGAPGAFVLGQFEQETGIALDRMLAALVPVVTVVMALLVGVVIMAVLMPLYDLTGAIG